MIDLNELDELYDAAPPPPENGKHTTQATEQDGFTPMTAQTTAHA